MSTPPKKVVVIGAGPVGSLAALYFSHANWEVELYELRGDLRLPENLSLNFSKSINLALSDRGIDGLRNVGDNEVLLKKVLEETIPMHGRMIHSGKPSDKGMSQGYDVHGRFIRSADRWKLNVQILDALAERGNVKMFFNHGLRKMDLDAGEVEFENTKTKESVTVHTDLVVGADGAHSATRRLLQKSVQMYYEQTYIDTLWQEYHIPPHPTTGDFQLSPNHLHIWPKQTYMFIAIPSADKTFTCTLFMSPSLFADLGESREKHLAFFKKNFEDVIPLVGEDALFDQFMRNPRLPLISVKCDPYHYKDRAIIIGDAAHAMVPFYGQGMNAGLEDVRVLFDHLALHPGDLAAALASYSKHRKPDSHCINDLAMRNYIEMRASVTSRAYLARKWVEEMLYAYVPWLGVRTMYSMVSFSSLRYSEVVARVRRQKLWMDTIAGGVVLAGVLGVGFVGLRGKTGVLGTARAVLRALREGQ
ncbi:uncharacterized protein H6S33_011779 [Morchella sextelata]|uniref:uncharacterized protein n=1 Tax=Morchella sextelata TaxID=1174677 RepID=UPI001D05440C|nr:uncharacterized protein H6S33_011779 [Morchella sextelata]KAH0610252.1 hypothetical protein H6S33_011779 [Morchella sextelata]